MNANVKKAIIPAAGYGTRFLPATKSVPKEMLPIVDVPTLEYIVDEAVASGITEICILIGRGKECVVNHFDKNFEVETQLKKNLNDAKSAQIALMNKYQGKVSFVFVRQPEMRGTGAAIELCKAFTGSEPFAVLFGDDLIHNPENPVTAQLIRAYQNTGAAAVVGVQEMPAEQAVNYGVVVYDEKKGRYMGLKGFKEKPKMEELHRYSRFASLGRFVLTPDIFDAIAETPAAQNGEVYLPTAIEILAKNLPVYAYDFEGKRYDIGEKVGFLQANIEYGLRHKETAARLKEYLKELVKTDFKGI